MGHLGSVTGTVQVLACSMALDIGHSAHTQRELLPGSAAPGGERKTLAALRGLMPLSQHRQPQFASSSPVLQEHHFHEYSILSGSSLRSVHAMLTPSQRTLSSSFPPPYGDAVPADEVGWVGERSGQTSPPPFLHTYI